MSFPLVFATALAMLAFAGNSVICRLALEQGAIDPASFTSVRLISGAIMLLILVLVIPRKEISDAFQSASQTTRESDVINLNKPLKNSLNQTLKRFLSFDNSNWYGAMWLFAYAAGFSFAYITLPAGTGALILFATVQITMLSHALFNNVSLSRMQWIGFLIALLGLVYLFLPGLSAPPLLGSFLMMIAGISWGAYSILGKKVANAMQSSTENFIRAIVPTILLSLIFLGDMSMTKIGILLAITSGAITSGVGYAIWYSVLPKLKSASAASLQLTVPVIATIGGVIWLNEALSIRLIIASASILGGVALVVLMPKKT
jgi:drug/metabolite transporter (DMT)-like permease